MARDTCITAISYNFFPLSSPAGNAFVVSLAIADLLVAFYLYPLVLMASFHNGWVMGYLHCQTSGFLMGMSVIGSIFNTAGVAINRYCYVCHSLKYDRLFPSTNTPVPTPCATWDWSGHSLCWPSYQTSLWSPCNTTLMSTPTSLPRWCPVHHHFGDGPLLTHHYHQLLLPEDLGACHPGTAQGEARHPPQNEAP